MKLLADEGVDGPVVELLRQNGHQIWYVAEMSPGISDEEVLDMANREGAILLTADTDFGELVFRQRLLSPGVVLIRLAGVSPAEKAQIVAAVITDHESELAQAFVVVTPTTLRIRR